MHRLARHSVRSLLIVLLGSSALTASAASDIHASKSGNVSVGIDKIVAVLGSGDLCDEGCRYYAPHVKKEVKVSHKASAQSFYKWTYVSGIKTVKFFKHVQVSKAEQSTKITIRTLDAQKDAQLIAELEKASGLKHEPLFDASQATYVVAPSQTGSQVDVHAMTRISGVISVLSGTVKKEMAKSLDAMFENFER